MLTLKLITALHAVAILNSLVDGYSRFQDAIPNGHIVPDPCSPNTTIWPGVGHKNMMGGGDKNPFGIDFKTNNFRWTVVCPFDSDGDGWTNGQELGDPTCAWTPGALPARSTALTHPGICEPLNSVKCNGKNTWLTCSEFNCSAFSQPGVKNMSLVLPRTTVPAQQTTYICYNVQLPNDTDYDIIGFTPLIDNPTILHHMLIYGFTSDIPVNIPPYRCEMGVGSQSMIGLWGFGAQGYCLSDQYGFQIGPKGYTYAVIQLHWNNPMLVSNYQDGSGFLMYYTPHLRPNRGEILFVGQLYLPIPPHQSSVQLSGTCTSSCTKALNNTIVIASAVLHMHLLGKGGSIVHTRNGAVVNELVNIPVYSYNSPTIVQFQKIIQFMPGDELTVNCIYDSTSRQNVTNYGQSTTDEMCFGFMAYYAHVDNLDFCGQFNGIEICPIVPFTIPNCDLDTFFTLVDLMGAPHICDASCPKPCLALAMDLVDTGCLSDDDRLFFISLGYLPDSFWYVMHVCQALMPATTTVNMLHSRAAVLDGVTPAIVFAAAASLKWLLIK